MMAGIARSGAGRPAPVTLRDNTASWQYPPRWKNRALAQTTGALAGQRFKTVAFTGHRPEKLPWGTDEMCTEALMYKFRLREALEYLIGRGYVNFLSGAARGFDTIAAEIVLSLREIYPWVRLVVVLPCADQATRWNDSDRARWEHIVQNSDHVETMAPAFDRGCMFRRNRYLVDNADMVLAAYDGRSGGGTAMTVEYARKRGVKVRRLGFEKKPTGNMPTNIEGEQ